MKKNKFGFTLIEVLAVVLIVALLTSIALPQYRKSIRRAESMEALVNLRTIFDSAKRYKSATSQAPMKLKGLDVEFFDATSDEDSQFSIGNFTYTFYDNRIEACRGEEYCLRYYYKYDDDLGRDILTCKQGTNSWVCESIGGKEPIATGEWQIE